MLIIHFLFIYFIQLDLAIAAIFELNFLILTKIIITVDLKIAITNNYSTYHFLFFKKFLALLYFRSFVSNIFTKLVSLNLLILYNLTLILLIYQKLLCHLHFISYTHSYFLNITYLHFLIKFIIIIIITIIIISTNFINCKILFLKKVLDLYYYHLPNFASCYFFNFIFPNSTLLLRSFLKFSQILLFFQNYYRYYYYLLYFYFKEILLLFTTFQIKINHAAALISSIQPNRNYLIAKNQHLLHSPIIIIH